MQILKGRSERTSGRDAVAEAIDGWPADAAPDFVLAFASTKQPLSEVAEALRARFPEAQLAGCSTSGEHLDGHHSRGNLVVMGVRSSRLRVTAWPIRDLDRFGPSEARALADAALANLGRTLDTVDPRRHFALLFVDALARAEERVAAYLADALDGMPVVGGSAGDDLAFERTEVLCGGEAFANGAVVVVGESDVPFETFKHQHFHTTPRALAITRADPGQRRVYELDGYTALDAYAAALDREPSEVTTEVAFSSPVVLSYRGDIYVRSIQTIEEDGSMTFYCGIEEGMVLEIGGHDDMASSLEADFATLRARFGQAELLIGCNCILRSLEADAAGAQSALGALTRAAAKHAIGFDTYGEQLNGLHINQTLVALAFGDPSQAEGALP